MFGFKSTKICLENMTLDIDPGKIRGIFINVVFLKSMIKLLPEFIRLKFP